MGRQTFELFIVNWNIYQCPIALNEDCYYCPLTHICDYIAGLQLKRGI